MKGIAITGAFLFCQVLICKAQELSPRAYWPSPKGTKVAVAGYSHAHGDVLMDPSSPLYGVDSRINTGILAYMQSFSLLGRTTNYLVELPYSWGLTTGTVVNVPGERKLSGFGDIGITLAINLLGAPTMTPADYQELRRNPRVILATSIKVQLPTGQYMTDKLINVGSNRWSFKPELGVMIPLWFKSILEIEFGAWFFTRDNDFLQGTRRQEPVLAAELHLVKRLKSGFWVSLDANYYRGGRQTIGDKRLDDLQRNSKIGLTAAVPFGRRHAVKLGYSIGLATAYGTDFNQFLATYTLLLNKIQY